jgi:hypothetical protein
LDLTLLLDGIRNRPRRCCLPVQLKHRPLPGTLDWAVWT